ncbi:hypothetical protein [Nostoc sp. PCC 7107]|nr:hypothetical protein [Nostoc sp. PCC 7107]
MRSPTVVCNVILLDWVHNKSKFQHYKALNRERAIAIMVLMAIGR